MVQNVVLVVGVCNALSFEIKGYGTVNMLYQEQNKKGTSFVEIPHIVTLPY
jgi:hypothetical protein